MSVKPIFSLDNVGQCARDIYGLNVLHIKEYPSYEDKNYRLTCSMGSGNPACSTEMFYLMKISRKCSSRDKATQRTQVLVMDNLTRQGFICPQHLKTVDGKWIYEFQHNTGTLGLRCV